MWGNIFSFRTGERSGWFGKPRAPTGDLQQPIPTAVRDLRGDAVSAGDPTEPITEVAPVPPGIAGALSRVFGAFAFLVVVAAGLFLYHGYGTAPSALAPSRMVLAPDAPPIVDTGEPSPPISPPLAPDTNGALGARAPGSDLGPAAPPVKSKRKSKGSSSRQSAPASNSSDVPFAFSASSRAKGAASALAPKALPKSAAATPRSPNRTLQ
jgi:hypothetical protein